MIRRLLSTLFSLLLNYLSTLTTYYHFYKMNVQKWLGLLTPNGGSIYKQLTGTPNAGRREYIQACFSTKNLAFYFKFFIVKNPPFFCEYDVWNLIVILKLPRWSLNCSVYSILLNSRIKVILPNEFRICNPSYFD